MIFETFISALVEKTNWPFEFEDVQEIEGNCGSVHIDMKDGTSYFLIIEKCEPEEPENIIH